MPAKLSSEKIASALADAVLIGDKKAAKKYGIGVRSLNRYRESLDPESPLAAEVQKCLNEQDKTWSGEIPEVLKNGMALLNEAVLLCDPSDLSKVMALTSEVMLPMSEMMMAREVLRKRLDA